MPNHGLTFTPRGRGRVGSPHGTGGVRSRYLPFSEHSLSNVQTFQRFLGLSPFFHILAHSFAHFCTHAKLNPFVSKQFRTLCVIHEGGVVVTSTPYSPDRLELSTASDVAVLGDQRQALGQGGRANEAVAGITGIIRGKLLGQDGNFHGDGPDGRPGRDLLDEVLHGSPNAKMAVSRQPRQLPQSDRRDGNPALFDGRTDSRGGLFREFRGVAGEPNQDVGIQEDHFFMTFHCFSGTTRLSISPVILNSPAMKPKRLFLRGSTGTTFTTGVPRLVTMTGSPVAWTSFMIERHRALKTLARICFMVSSLCLWS